MSRFGYFMATYVIVLAIIVLAFVQITPRWVWNASASTPIGLYAITRVKRLTVSTVVAVRPPEPLATFLAKRGYLPRGVPLMKHIAALPGQQVCRINQTILIDDHVIGTALPRDHNDRDLPVWQGCIRLGDDDLFLMNSAVGSSLDGRYFGPTPISAVLGQARPLYTDEDGDGRFEWRTQTH